MKYSLLKEMYEMEGDYWWHKAKRDHVFFLIRKFMGTNNVKILDVGCGAGYFLKEAEKYGEVYGIDKSKESLYFSRKRGLKNLKFHDVEKSTPFVSSFNVVTALDVIEHIKNDKIALKHMAESLKKEGILVIVTPAFPQLWSYWDEAAGHFRRYDKKSIIKLFTDAQLKIEYINFSNSSIFLIAVVIRYLKENVRLSSLGSISSDFIKVPKLLNSFLYFMLRIEMQISFYLPLPFGLSFVIVGRKI